MPLPEGYIRISDAVRLLTQGMYGNLPRPHPINELKRKHGLSRLRFGPRREHAARELSEAANRGELTIYIWAPPAGPEQVPLKVVQRLFRARAGLTDHPYRISLSLLRSTQLQPALFAAFQGMLAESEGWEERAGVLLVKEAEFQAWYRRERVRGKWPSQCAYAKPKRGRPTRGGEGLRNIVLGAVEDSSWNSGQGVRALARMLGERGCSVPSHDTLERLVDKLFRETGNPAFLRKERRSRLLIRVNKADR
jgi:hypothetical protein